MKVVSSIGALKYRHPRLPSRKTTRSYLCDLQEQSEIQSPSGWGEGQKDPTLEPLVDRSQSTADSPQSVVFYAPLPVIGSSDEECWAGPAVFPVGFGRM